MSIINNDKTIMKRIQSTIFAIVIAVYCFIGIMPHVKATADNNQTFVNQPYNANDVVLIENSGSREVQFRRGENVYIFILHNTTNNHDTIGLISKTQQYNVQVTTYPGGATKSTDIYTLIENTDYYINLTGIGNEWIYYTGGLTFNIPIYSWNGNYNSIPYNTIVTDINNGGSTTISSSINYSLPSGNIAIIETDNSYTRINLTTTMPLQSTSFANNPWPNTTQRVGYYNTLPQSINPNTMGNVIEWERNGNTTLFNITTSAKYNPSIVSTFKYIVISNPYYYPANDMEDSQYTNGDINISMDGVINISVKSLTATVNTQTGVVENNYNGQEWTGEIDETTHDITWTDGNGDNNAPTSGGNLSDPSITGFQSWLKGILNNIVNIFQPAHDAINTLSGAVSNFASWMYALYVWLPSPILSLLTSAISLAIVIGIIKVFI